MQRMPEESTVDAFRLTELSFNLIDVDTLMMRDLFKGRSFSSKSDEVDELTKTINEQSDEQRKIVSQFDRAMNAFATERSLETCLEALNLAIQLSNVRNKIAESYEYYARMLEREVVRLTKQVGDGQV